jgi:TusA-related sulfurtransferase
MNLVYVKFELAKPAPGKILKIIIDDGAPVENDSRSLEEQGHCIVRRERLGEGTWSLFIRGLGLPVSHGHEPADSLLNGRVGGKEFGHPAAGQGIDNIQLGRGRIDLHGYLLVVGGELLQGFSQ